jgi:single stranded DNA-binding protein
MFCKNRTTLIGFIGNDAETRFTASGLAQTRFSVATNARWKDRESGEYRTRTEWHRIVVWGKFAEWAGSLKKGAFVEVEGELRYREFQPEGFTALRRTPKPNYPAVLPNRERRKENRHEPVLSPRKPVGGMPGHLQEEVAISALL